jgi:superoxide reductase
VTKLSEVYLCKICGNEVKVINAGNGTLVCCGQPMSLVKA